MLDQALVLDYGYVAVFEGELCRLERTSQGTGVADVKRKWRDLPCKAPCLSDSHVVEGNVDLTLHHLPGVPVGEPMANEYDLASHKSSVATFPVPILLIIALAIACLGHKVKYEAGTRGAAEGSPSSRCWRDARIAPAIQRAPCDPRYGPSTEGGCL